MSEGDFAVIEPARLAWQGPTPVACDFDDPYFSRDDGAAESDHVFLQGNRLPARFAALRPGECFTIGETGFGTGLNLLLAARLFQEQAPSGTRLDLYSAEKHPLTRPDLHRALAHWPALAHLSKALLTAYPPATPGFHRLWLAPDIALTLMLGDATALWRQCPAPVDAWFLDGFAPARNPAMWQRSLFDALANRSRPGATLATFTAAGFVRRGLIEAGFAMQKQPGFGRKRHMLVGQFGGTETGPTKAPPPILTSTSTPEDASAWRPHRQQCGQALILGAGLAGSTTARALAQRGWRVTVLDPNGIANGASGNLAGVVYSTPSAHLTAQNRFYQNSYLHALRWLQHHRFPDDVHRTGALNGVIQHYATSKQRDKIRLAATSGAWPADMLSADDAHAELHQGGYLNPSAWCARLLDHPAIKVRTQRATALVAGNPGTGEPARVILDDGRLLSADAVVIANAGASRHLPINGALPGWLPLKRIRGQVSYCTATPASTAWTQAQCHGGYLTPALNGLHCVGATFDLHDPAPEPRDADDAANLAQLKAFLPQQWQELGGEQIHIAARRVSDRCQSKDFLPLSGPLPDPDSTRLTPLPGLWLNVAHGSRGITGTPLCAEILADRISATTPPADQDLLDALDPARFLRRQRRKQMKLKVES